MNKEEMEEMAKALRVHCPVEELLDELPFDLYAANLLIYGYGNVKQAVKEFAEKLKNIVYVLSIGTEMDGSNLIIQVSELIKAIDNLITELYGADE